MSIDVHNETTYAIDETALSSLARHVLDAQRISPLAELSVILVDVEEMTLLHEKWMDEPGPTDVMSFEMDELRPGSGDADDPAPGLLGDVVICPEVAKRQAEAAGHSFEAEVALLLAHGILHLLGYDHEDPDEEREMFGEQRRLLDEWHAAQWAQVPGPDRGPAPSIVHPPIRKPTE